MITPDIQKTLDELRDLAKSAQQVVGDVRKSHEALDGRVAKISDELKAGAIDATTKAAYQDAVEKVAKHESSLDKLNAEVAELSKKATNLLSGGAANTGKSLGQLAAESDVCKTYRGGNAELVTMRAPLFGKAAVAVTSGAASAGALIQPHHAGVVMGPEQPLMQMALS